MTQLQSESQLDLYRSGEYIIRNPTLHEEDSPWKVTKIVPLLDRCIGYFNKDSISLLDVGGGTGLILNSVSNYIENTYQVKVNKCALDLSPRMLEIQKTRNPDLKVELNEDICKTSFKDKEIDIILMIDILEHISDAVRALEEVRRIANFAIFKVPLEDNLYLRILNFLKRGAIRQHAIVSYGHINTYNLIKLKLLIEKHTGEVLYSSFANAFAYYRNSEYYRHKMDRKSKLVNFTAANLFSLSPRLCSRIFSDFVILLVRCY
jgi:SAM-dependent methyltransferase